MSKKEKKASPEKGEERLGRRKRLAFIGVAAGAIVLLGALTAYAFSFQNRFLPHTTIAGVKVGGMLPDQATAAVTQKADVFLASTVTATADGGTWEIRPAEIGTSFNVPAGVAAAWNAQRAGGFKGQVAALLKAPFARHDSDLPFSAYSEDGEVKLGETVLSKIETPFVETSISFVPGNVAVVPGKAGTRLDDEAFAASLYRTFKSGGSVPLTLIPSSPEVTADQAEPARTKVAQLLAKPLSVSLVDGKAVTVSPEAMAGLLKTWVKRGEAGEAIGLEVGFDQAKLGTMVGGWAAQVNVAARNARLGYDEAKNVTIADPGATGIALDIDGTANAVNAYLDSAFGGSVQAILATAKQDVGAESLTALGLKQLIGTATTDFTGSPTGRVTNIKVGSGLLDQKVVKSGETFSTIANLKPIDASQGYVQELVIKGNRTTPEYGGGLCQVSTTLFRAVLNAGLPVIERQNHSYRVSYYEVGVGPGLDATVYDSSPDLKWKNDTGQTIYVQSFVQGKKITFELYGTSDGRSSVVSAPTILETYPLGSPVYVETATLDKGVTKQVEHPHEGAKTTVSYTVTRDGAEIYHKDFVSVYKMWPAQYLVGTREPAA